jgi:putative peptidoglycan lipid II flippase
MKIGGARLVAAGILLSRVFGLVRQRVSAHYLGNGPVADALAAAFRIPNLLQNLFGEGALSASFIPVYAKLLAEGKREEAGRVAGAVLAMLAVLVSVVVVLGIVAAPWLVQIIAPGLDLESRGLPVLLVRIIFPGLGLLVLSAWCLGVLNTHRRFFLSYASPVLWNAAIIVALVYAGARADSSQAQLAVAVAFASVAGAALQLLIQVPTVVRVEAGLRLRAGAAAASVRTVLRNFVPSVATRGVVQVSGYVDTLIASFLGAGALATLTYAQAISMLPVSLFGMSVAASELPAMSGATGGRDEIAAALLRRLERGLQRIAYFVIPSAVGLVVFGRMMASVLYEGGAFGRADAIWVWAALAGSGVGLLASTQGRLLSSASFALGDTTTPFRFAVVRVSIAAVLGMAIATQVPARFGLPTQLGVGFLTAASGLAAWIEYRLLRRHVEALVGRIDMPAAMIPKLWMSAGLAAFVGINVARRVGDLAPMLEGSLVLASFGASYLAFTMLLRVSHARSA